MKLQIVERPEKVLSDGHVCKFPAGYNPIKILVQREDYIITSAESETFDGEARTKINIIQDPDGFFPSAGYVYLKATEAAVIKIDLVSNIYPIYEPVEGVQVLTAVVLIDVPWDAEYSGIDGGFITAGTTDKQDIVVTGFIKDNLSYVFTPRRFSFNEKGIAHIYINSIVKDYFAKRLKVEDMYCIGQTLGIDLIMTSDNQNIEVQQTETISIDYGLVAVKSVRQLGNTKYMEDYAIYFAPENIADYRAYAPGAYRKHTADNNDVRIFNT